MDGPNWLGLLKWSLSYSDGTAPTAATPLSKEDQDFLTRVMEEAVRNDGQRMREIMLDIAAYLEEEVEETKSCEVDTQDTSMANSAINHSSSKLTGAAASAQRAASRAAAAVAAFRALGRAAQDEQIENELDELQDIVEQIDMAIDFITHLKGADCILDLVQDKRRLVGSLAVRCRACVVLGTLTQNNRYMSVEPCVCYVCVCTIGASTFLTMHI